ncbi:MAG: TolC family protein, partial [Sinobacteraceae bacterium]|nr:TolC family protein [Nevskiaceae bacterium]
MRLRLAHIFILAGLLAPSLASAGDLMQLYKTALNQDQTLAAARHTRDAAIEAKPQAWAGILPQLNASAGLHRQKTDNLATTSSFLTAGNHFYTTNKSWTLSFQDTLLSFATFRRIAQADIQVAAANNSLENARQSLILRVAQAYFNVLSTRDTLRADSAARDAFKAQLDEAKARFKVGLSTITDVQQAQASYDSSRATLIGDRRGLSNQRQALGVIVHENISGLQPLVSHIPLVLPTPAAAADWVQTASEDNLALRDAKLQWQIAQRDIGIQRAQRYPTLDL